MRRISLGMASFPKIPIFDSYYGYPVGTGQIWSPLFDYLLTILTLTVGLGKGDEQTARLIGFWLPPILSSFTVFMVYAVGKRLFGKTVGFASAFIIALLPGHILYSFVSELDHHVAEPMVSLAIFSCLLKEIESLERRPKKIFFPITGLWMATGILIWRGSLIFWGIALLSLAVHMFFGTRNREDTTKVTYYAMKVCLSSAALLTPACLFDVWQTAGVVSFNVVSWFHIIFLLVFALLYYLLSLIATRRTTSIPVAFGFFSLLSILVFILPAGRKFFLEFASGLAVIGGSDPWLDSISELRPMLFPNGKLDLLHATETLSIIYWLFPVLLITQFRKWKRDNFSSFGCCLFLVWGAT
ncbi:MAG: STT3 domain-containing protein, partial [Deltaproteobacteria bacterium]